MMAAALEKGLVSTIVPVYNRAALLGEAVESVLAQTYRPIEVIIVDDGSTDETGRAADELARKHPGIISVIHQETRGPGLAREAGRSAARGEFIQYLDSDDLLLPRKFELQVAGLRRHPECGVSYGKTGYCHIGQDLRDDCVKRTGEKIEFMFPEFLRWRWWETCTPLYRRELCDRAGPWTALWREEDWEYDCRIASYGVRLHYCGDHVAEARGGAPGRLHKRKDAAIWRDRAAAHTLILRHAQRAGIDEKTPEMRHFARGLFFLSRQCGAKGLAKESRELFFLAKEASGEARASGWDFRGYALLAGYCGWENAGKVARFFDTVRRL